MPIPISEVEQLNKIKQKLQGTENLDEKLKLFWSYIRSGLNFRQFRDIIMYEISGDIQKYLQEQIDLDE